MTKRQIVESLAAKVMGIMDDKEQSADQSTRHRIRRSCNGDAAGLLGNSGESSSGRIKWDKVVSAWSFSGLKNVKWKPKKALVLTYEPVK